MTDAKKLAETDLRAACDLVIYRAAEMCVADLGATIPQVLDRLLTYAAAQACTMEGSDATARNFHRFAENIEAGCFHSLTGEDGSHKGAKH